jgi:prepilin-type processing-associated H-X9-DG protein
MPLKAALAGIGGLALALLVIWLLAVTPVAGQVTLPAAGKAVPVPAIGLVAPSSLPVFQLSPPVVNPDVVMSLSGRFNAIGRQGVASDTTRGALRFTLANTATGSIFEQFGASGGFFASNANVAFGDGSVRGPLDPGTAKMLACDFLMLHQLFPAEAQNQDCALGRALPYNTIIASRTVFTPSGGAGSLEAMAGVSTTEQIAVIVQVPLAINISGAVPLPIPLRGPGGHLSLLFVSTEQPPVIGAAAVTPTLDSSVPGLAAVAEPWYQRQLVSRGNFNILSAAQAAQIAARQFRSELPIGAQVNPGTPVLAYWVGDPALPQENLVPTWVFSGGTAVVDGDTLNLRETTVLAAVGFAPTVHITSPADGSGFYPGHVVTVTGTISDGFGGPPYEIEWSRDDGTVLASGSVPAAGQVALVTSDLPFAIHAGVPASVTIRLLAVDSIGASAMDQVSLQPGPLVTFLPLTMRAISGGAAAQAPQAPQDIPAASTYGMGVEWVANYNGTNPNLSGVIPDGNHFYSGLQGYGWSGIFKWTNNLAWERDWRDCGLSGSDCTYGVDRADFVYFSGHGSVARIYFGVSHDALNFYGNNARFQNVRWAGFSSCNTIRGTDMSHWFSAFQGAHMLMGFHSTMADVDFGGPLVDNMRIPHFWLPFLGDVEFPSLQRTIREAWVQTAYNLNAGRPAYIYAVGNGVDPSNNKLPKGGDAPLPRPFPVAAWYWVWWSLPGD